MISLVLCLVLTLALSRTGLSAETPPAAAVPEVAGLRGALRTHDPSTIFHENGKYWVFGTGRGCVRRFSTDLRTWEAAPPVFPKPLAWWTEVAPGTNLDCWAPDLIKLGEKYCLYYSMSVFGKSTSAIGLATAKSLAEAEWQDEGVVIQTKAGEGCNAIDPGLCFDGQGRLWMVFGSYWTGIKLLELDPHTGRRLKADSPLHALAAAPKGATDIEAAYLYRHAGWYYLFANRGQCCKGVESNYHIIVGRSRAITGPYVDREGQEMLRGGGSPFLDRQDRFIGPGHAGIFNYQGATWLSYHIYDGQRKGVPTLMLAPLTWDAQGWPVAGKPGLPPLDGAR